MSDEEKRTMPIRTQRIEMDGDYAGFHVVMRVNISMATLHTIYESDDIMPTLAGLIHEWNFVDEAGEPIGVSVEGLRACPLDLVGMLKSKYAEALRSPLPATTSPGSLSHSRPAVSRRRRSSRK